MDEKQSRKMGYSDTVEDFAEYRPISSLAIVSFLIGLTSLGALASMVLWILPVIAIAFSLIVLASINRPDVKPIGKSLAVFSLWLAVLVAFWAPTRHFSRMWKLSAMARSYTQEWLDLIVVNENLDRAHALTKTYGEKMLDASGSAGMGGVSRLALWGCLLKSQAPLQSRTDSPNTPPISKKVKGFGTTS